MSSIGRPSRTGQKKELHRMVVARSDLNAALEACELVLKHVNDLGSDFYMPLLNAIAISYARPFTHNRPAGPLGATWTKFDDPRLQATHDMLLDLRHTFVAHSDRSVRRVNIVPPGAPVPGVGIAPKLAVTVGIVGIPIERFKDIRDLCLYLGRRIHHAADTLLNELYGNRELPNSMFALEFNNGL